MIRNSRTSKLSRVKKAPRFNSSWKMSLTLHQSTVKITRVRLNQWAKFQDKEQSLITLKRIKTEVSRHRTTQKGK
jgi:hypothetical protein